MIGLSKTILRIVLASGFAKKVQNLERAVALHFMYYNFARIH